MAAMATPRPATHEYLPYYDRYISLVPDGAIAGLLASQAAEYRAFYQTIDAATATHRYAPGKWSIKQVLGHVIDTERVFAFRAFAISRGERQPLPGFEQDDYIAGANFDDRAWNELVDELATVRAATVALFAGMSDAMLGRTGTVWTGELSAHAAGFVIAGHERYHVAGLREKYLTSAA